MRVTARIAHEVPPRPPIRVHVGQKVTAGDRSAEWPEFVFVVTAEGAGWVPGRYLTGASGEVTVRVEYDTTELPVTSGQRLTVIDRDDRSGWWWCRNDDGAEGWVPLSVFAAGG